ncbi:MAG: hypothetical protein LBC39_06785 [Methanobrevibacter sp.]|jgi:hypothetical protein|nr:hypothetical protein [Candidatus Methanovirga aequatorialis]
MSTVINNTGVGKYHDFKYNLSLIDKIQSIQMADNDSVHDILGLKFHVIGGSQASKTFYVRYKIINGSETLLSIQHYYLTSEANYGYEGDCKYDDLNLALIFEAYKNDGTIITYTDYDMYNYDYSNNSLCKEYDIGF